MSGLGRRSSALGRPLEGWRVASKGLGPLPRRRGSALAHGCGRGGRVVLPLARAAAVSTGLSVPLGSRHSSSSRASRPLGLPSSTASVGALSVNSSVVLSVIPSAS